MIISLFLGGTSIQAAELLPKDTYISEVSNSDYIPSNKTDKYEHVIGMYESEVAELYYNFLNEQNRTTFSDNTETSIDAFVEYSVEQGVINDTVEQREVLTKAALRLQFALIVEGGRLRGYTTAAEFLNHSLQDNPTVLYYLSGTAYATQIYNSTECQSIITAFKKQVIGKGLLDSHMSGGTTLNSTTDLHLAYNNVDYIVDGTRNGNVWTVKITFRDRYDFEPTPWENAMTDNALVTIINDYAVVAQTLGAIVPYNIKVEVKFTFKELGI